MSRKRILLAEDHDDFREVVAFALRDDGHEVLEVSRGDDLLHALMALRDRDANLDLVISDLEMPGMSGLDALELAGGTFLSLPVVLMTGSVDPTLTRRAGRLEVGCIFRKPIDINALRATAIALMSKPTV